MAYLVGKLYPDHTFSIGINPIAKKKLEDALYDNRIEESEVLYKRSELVYGRRKLISHRQIDGEAVQSKIYHSMKSSQSRKRPRKYGLQGISRNGKRTVRCIAVMMQREYGRKRIALGTCTVPGFSKEVLASINVEWRNITRGFYQSLRRLLIKRGAPLDVVGVTEIQPNRLKGRLEVGLHIHFCYVATKKGRGDFYVTADEFRRIWRRQIKAALCRQGVGTYENLARAFTATFNGKLVTKSVSNYLGKYVSKGVSDMKTVRELGYEAQLPSQWWTASVDAKKKLKKAIVRLPFAVCKELFYNYSKWVENGDIVRFKQIFVESQGEEKNFGLWGQFSESAAFCLGGFV